MMSGDVSYSGCIHAFRAFRCHAQRPTMDEALEKMKRMSQAKETKPELATIPNSAERPNRGTKVVG